MDEKSISLTAFSAPTRTLWMGSNAIWS